MQRSRRRQAREPFPLPPDYPGMNIRNVAAAPDIRLDDPRVDALLAVRCQLGERAAFDELIRRWAEPLRHS